MPMPVKEVPLWSLIPLQILACIINGCSYFPVFACISRKDLLSHSVTALYLGLQIAADTYAAAACTNIGDTCKTLLVVVITLPTTACKMDLLFVFLKRVALQLLPRRRNDKCCRWHAGDSYDTYSCNYVKDILATTKLIRTKEPNRYLLEKNKRLTKRKIQYQMDRIKQSFNRKRRLAFIFPPRFVCTLFASLVTVFLLFLVTMIRVGSTWRGARCRRATKMGAEQHSK